MNNIKPEIEEALQISGTLLSRVKDMKKKSMKKFLGIDESIDLMNLYRSGLSCKWNILRLNELAAPEGIAPESGIDISNDKHNAEAGCPIIKQEYIKDLRFLPENYQYISEEDAAEYRHLILQGGDIIIDIENGGTSTLLPFMHENSIPGPGLIRVRINSELCEVFYMLNILHFYYNTGILNELLMQRNKSKMNMISSLLVPAPPLEKQKEIADYMLGLSGFMVAQENYRNEINKLESIINL